MSIDWNGKLAVVNASPLSTPYPTDRVFWIVTEEGEAREVAYNGDYKLYTGRETYCRVDGESGSWEPDEIAGWTDSREDAEEAAELLCQFMGWASEREKAASVRLASSSGPEPAPGEGWPAQSV